VSAVIRRARGALPAPSFGEPGPPEAGVRRRRALGRALGCVLCVAALGAPRAARAAEADALEARLASLLAEAMADATPETADPKIREAENLLKTQGQNLESGARAFLEADVHRARGRVALAAWRRAPDDAAPREEARRALLRALDGYDKLLKVAEDKAELLESQRGGEADLAAAYAQIARANYAMAWTEYSLGLAVPEEKERQEYLETASDRFARVVGEQYPTDPLPSSETSDAYRKRAIVADCFLGAALCLAELKRPADVLKLLEPTSAANTPRNVYERMTLLRIKAHQASGAHREAATVATQYFDALKPEHKLGTVELQAAIEWARSLIALAKDDAGQRGQAAKRLDEIRKLVSPCGGYWVTTLADLRGEAGAGGATSYRRLVEARELFDAQKFEEALDAALKGLAAATKDTEAGLLADLRYTRTAACWNLKRWLDAHRAAVDFLQHHPNERRAAETCALALQAALKARGARPPLDAAEFLQFLDLAEKRFPDHPELKKAAWYRASLLLEAKRYDEAEKILQAVPPTSPISRMALYGLALAAHDRAKALLETKKADPETLATHYAHMAAAATRFIKATEGDETLPEDQRPFAEAIVDIAVAAAGGLLDLPSPDYKAALDLLDSVRGWRHAGQRAVDEQQALRIRACVAMGNFDGALELIDVALARDARSAHLAHALATIVDPLEREYERLEREGKTPLAEGLARRLVDIYTRLLLYVQADRAKAGGESELNIRRRLARNQVRIRHYGRALPHCEWVLERLPKEKAGDMLRGAALGREETQSYDKAVEAWRDLARGLPRNTSPWFEAHYHLILCHHKAGRDDHAARLMAFFRLQVHDIADEAWKRQFEALERELSEKKPATEPPRS